MVSLMNFLPLLFLQCTLSIWASYGIQQEDVALVRTKLLLRTLIVDSDPFQGILLSCFNYLTSPFQRRFVFLYIHTVCTLSRIKGYQVLLDCFE